MKLFALAAFQIALAFTLQAQSESLLRVVVTDARNGQTLPQAQVVVEGLPSQGKPDRFGGHTFAHLNPGIYNIDISAAGYRQVSQQADTTTVHKLDVVVKLVPVAFARVDTVSVSASIRTEAADTDQTPLAMNRGEVQSLAGVLTDDPMRAVQALPGVASDDDFEASFSLRGMDFDRIGVYLDGVLLHDALHSLQGTDLSGSSSVFNTSLVENLDLYEDTRPENLTDSSGAALQVHMREGDRDRTFFRVNINLAGAGFSAGGPLGHAGASRCSWIGGYRKTYLQYILSHFLTDPSMAFGVSDGEGQLSCLVNRQNTVSLEIVDSDTNLNRTAVKGQLGANDVMLVGQHATATNLSWAYAPDAKTVIVSHAAWMEDSFSAQNPILDPLGHGSYGEWSWNSNATRALTSNNSLSLGGSLRVLHDGGFEETYDSFRAIELMDLYHGTDILSGGYAEDAWTAIPSRLRITAGGRWERDATDRISTYSPQAGVALRLVGPLQMEAGYGQYVQYPTPSIFGSNLGNSNLLPMRSTQASAALSDQVSSTTSVRVEFYDRQDRDLLYQPYADPRMMDGVLFIPPINPQYENSLRGYGRGIETSIRRRLGHGVTGWVSYAYGRSMMHDGATGDVFPSDFDQRHTANAFASYQLRPSVTLSAHWTYGSGFPVPGFLTSVGPPSPSLQNIYLTDERNTLRIGPYQRVDFRLNKTWTHERRRTSLYLEVLNLTDKTNLRFGSLDAYRPDGSTYVSVDQMFPILPSAGVVFSW